MAYDINGEEFAVQVIRNMIFDNHVMKDGTDTGMPRIAWAFQMYGVTYDPPDGGNGYSDSVTYKPRDDASKITVWSDSVLPVKKEQGHHGNQYIFWERMNLAVMYTYSVKQEHIGSHGRKVGQIIRDIIISQFHRKTPNGIEQATNLLIGTDYRFGSERMQGGSRRGRRGNLKPTGSLRESIIVTVDFDMRRTIETFF